MADKLKIISLGGLNEIGKNLTVYECGNDIIVVDCGMGFPDDDMYGIDCIIPDVTYLIKNRARIRGLFSASGLSRLCISFREEHGLPCNFSDRHFPVPLPSIP